jgi:hypothetical protein
LLRTYFFRASFDLSARHQFILAGYRIVDIVKPDEIIIVLFVPGFFTSCSVPNVFNSKVRARFSRIIFIKSFFIQILLLFCMQVNKCMLTDGERIDFSDERMIRAFCA